MGSVKQAEIVEMVRHQLVASMAFGKFLIIDIGNGNGKFLCEDHGEDVWQPNKIFDYNEWCKEEVVMKIVREDEKRNHMGESIFSRGETFAFGIWTANEQAADDLMKVMPNADKFRKINVL